MLRDIVAIRGGGEIGTAIAHKLKRSGFKVFIIENDTPISIRRTVAYAQAVFHGEMTVEGIRGVNVSDAEGIITAWEKQEIPVIVDSQCDILNEIPVDVLVDAIMARKNTGTTRDMAAITIATGPGFIAGEDVDIVIETKKGHDQGRLIFDGAAEPETAIPGESEGVEMNKVANAPIEGVIHTHVHIGDMVKKGQLMAEIAGVSIHAQISGIVRGIIHDGSNVWRGLKILEIDPDVSPEQCYRLSQRSRDVAGGVLEAVLYLKQQHQLNTD
ncbi:selenium-dependent molybdenum cofactor biosynthesis protein YqeB [Anoxynatronum sibiricum]|uniref:Selenium-dependent molybdenum cofactor biosynthesis protein YqeB n=2 Tax=Anoxynatronum sibiricum TaxID=210623 RepID=A0ABU9VPW3_9CLOT